ncbi:hypothetical protein [Streptomyces olivaceiscleroticus]|uniref:Uncharacterized protein n=1 Tax=Streptomyces olivaceiscleroticus TaxID=68245 RepID=A0ABP3JI41_9ACTN
MNPEPHPVGHDADHPTAPTVIWQPNHPDLARSAEAALTLYQVPVPDSIPVQLPDGRTAWARHIQPQLAPTPVDTSPREPMPALAKTVCAVAGSLTVLALGGATALRIAAPALGGLVELLDTIWRVALTLAAILFGVVAGGRFLFAKTPGSEGADRADRAYEQPMVFAPQIDTSGGRLLGRGGDVNIQLGDRNRNKQ